MVFLPSDMIDCQTPLSSGRSAIVALGGCLLLVVRLHTNSAVVELDAGKRFATSS
jgi:hypothetical protein